MNVHGFEVAYFLWSVMHGEHRHNILQLMGKCLRSYLTYISYPLLRSALQTEKHCK